MTERHSVSRMREFHLQLRRVEGPGGLVVFISNTMAWWSLCVQSSLTAHDKEMFRDHLKNPFHQHEICLDPLVYRHQR
ncbi:hypothetical protein TKK_0018797 [Trichogramma kaykai]